MKEIFLEKTNKWNNILECLIITTKTDLEIKKQFNDFYIIKIMLFKDCAKYLDLVFTQPRWGSRTRSSVCHMFGIIASEKETVHWKQLISFVYTYSDIKT